MGYSIIFSDTLAHHGVLGMKWGVRRYQNPDGSLTDLGRKRLYKGVNKTFKKNPYDPNAAMDTYKEDLATRKVINTEDYLKAVTSLHDLRALAKDSMDIEDQYEEALLKTANKLFDKYQKEHPEINWNDEKLSDRIFIDIHNEEASKIVDKSAIGKKYIDIDAQSKQLYSEYEDSCKRIVDSVVGEYGDKTVSLIPGIVETKYRVIAETAINSLVEDGAGNLDDVLASYGAEWKPKK